MSYTAAIFETEHYIPSLVRNENQIKEGNLSGRITTEIKDFFIDFGKGCAEAARKTAVYVGQLFRDFTSLARVCRLGINLFSVIEKSVGCPGMFTAINTQLAISESLIYTVSAGDQITYFGTNKHLEESMLQNIGQGWLLAAGIGGGCVLLTEVFLSCFSKVSEAIGSIPFFAAMSDVGIGLGQIVSGIASVGFLAFACDSARKLANAVKFEERVQACIDLAWNVSELALSIFMTVCSDLSENWITLLILGSLSAGLGIASFIYARHVEATEEEEKKKLKLI